MNDWQTTVLALAAAVIVPGVWGWAAYWLYLRCFLQRRPERGIGEASAAKAPGSADSAEWSYQI